MVQRATRVRVFDDLLLRLAALAHHDVPLSAVDDVLDLRQLVAVDDAERQAVFAGCRAMLHAAGEPLLRRAQDARIVRPDVTIEEVVEHTDPRQPLEDYDKP